MNVTRRKSVILNVMKQDVLLGLMYLSVVVGLLGMLFMPIVAGIMGMMWACFGIGLLIYSVGGSIIDTITERRS